jgi:hypothetical protein
MPALGLFVTRFDTPQLFHMVLCQKCCVQVCLLGQSNSITAADEAVNTVLPRTAYAEISSVQHMPHNTRICM